MKKKNKNNQENELITEKHLAITMSEFDKKVDEKFVKYTERLMKYLDHRFEPLEAMAKDYYSFKDKVLTSLDWLVGAFKKFDEEHTILSGKYSEVNEKLDDHDRRIMVLEKKTKYKAS